MGDTTTLPAPPVRHDEWLDRRWRLTGAVVVLLWAFTALGLVASGERQSSYGDLLGAVGDGRVDEVTIVGPSLDQDWRGTVSVELRWSGWVDHHATVTVERRADGTTTATAPGAATGDPREAIRMAGGDVRVVSRDHTGPWTEAFGWRVPGVVAATAFLGWLSALVLLIGGPQPWRATRWAWGWLFVLGPPVATVAYVLLGGPLGAPRPRNAVRRLTGGWAFLLFLALFAGARAG